MIPSTYSEISNAAADGRAFCVRFEYSGYNGKNASRQSNKFWCYERPYNGAPIQVRYGAIGTSGQTRNQGISIWDARDRADKKECKGYNQVSMTVEAPATPVAKPSLSEWAATMPPPFNTITSIDSEGRATNASGQLVCELSLADATTIRDQYDLSA